MVWKEKGRCMEEASDEGCEGYGGQAKDSLGMK
jgi:hypothetical protein